MLQQSKVLAKVFFVFAATRIKSSTVFILEFYLKDFKFHKIDRLLKRIIVKKFLLPQLLLEPASALTSECESEIKPAIEIIVESTNEESSYHEGKSQTFYETPFSLQFYSEVYLPASGNKQGRWWWCILLL